MYEVQEWAEVHRLCHQEGWAKSKIGETFGMSRNTVARLVELSEPPRYRRARRVSKLDPHKGSIARMLDTDPKVAATVVIEHLRRDGCGGGHHLEDYLADVRPLLAQAKSYQRASISPRIRSISKAEFPRAT